MEIIKQTSTSHTGIRKCGIEYIVLHYTASTSSKKGRARATAKYFANSDRNASADFIVDDEEIVQYNPSPISRYTYAVGGNKYKSLTNVLAGKFYGSCTNANSISIEMCSSKQNTKSLSADDKDWSITDSVVENTLKLVLFLMSKYNIDLEHVITHNEVTGKLCPQPWTLDDNSLEKWYEFRKSIIEHSKSTKSKPTPTIRTTCILNCRTEPNMDGVVINKFNEGVELQILEYFKGWGRCTGGWINLDYVTENV